MCSIKVPKIENYSPEKFSLKALVEQRRVCMCIQQACLIGKRRYNYLFRDAYVNLIRRQCLYGIRTVWSQLVAANQTLY